VKTTTATRVLIFLLLLCLPAFGQTTKPIGLPFLAKKTKIALKPGAVYELRVQQDGRGCTFYTAKTSTTQPNAVILYYGGIASGAFKGDATFTDVDFNVGPGRNCWKGEGTFRATRVNFWGGGGLAEGKNATINLDHCTQKVTTDKFVLYSSNSIVTINAASFQHGSRFESIDREQLSRGYKNTNSTYDDRGHIKAAIRIHDSQPGSVCSLNNSRIFGDAWFGPYKPDPVIGKRLYKLIVNNVTFDTESFNVDVGILDGTFSRCKIMNSSGGAVIDTRGDFLDRPHSVVRFSATTLTHKDGTGRPFSNASTADRFIVAPDCKFNGKPLVWTPATQPATTPTR